MKNGKYTARRTSGTKVFALLLSLVLVMGCAIGGTLAWLTATSDTVSNTFTVGDINIKLVEHEYVPATNTLNKDKEVTSNNNYKMVPGYTMPKDPIVTVLANSEPCYLFIKVEKSTNFDTFMEYVLNTGDTVGCFKQLTDAEGKTIDGVYYMTVGSSTAMQEYCILNAPTGNYEDNTYDDGYVKVRDGVTKAQLNEVGENKPTIKFTAYAIQQYKSFDEEFEPYEAWNNVYTAATTDSTT